MFQRWTLKRFFKTAAKVIGWISLSFISLLFLLILAVQIPIVQNKIIQKTVHTLQEKLGTTVTLGHISLSFPKRLVLEDLYVEDQLKDTLLYGGTLSINTDLWSLLHNRVQLNDVSLDNWRVFISRPSLDQPFSYEFIPAAFTAAPSDDTTSSPTTPWTFAIGNVELTRAYLSYQDVPGGDDIDINLGRLEIDVDALDLEQSSLLLNTLEIEDSKVLVSISQVSNPTTNLVSDSAYTKPFQFGIKHIVLRNVKSVLKNISIEQVLNLDVGEFELKANHIDLAKKKIDLETVSISNTFFSYQRTGASTSTANEADTTVAPETPWALSLKKLDLAQNSFQYYDFSTPPTDRRSIDFNHLWLTRVNVQAEDLVYDGNSVNGKVQDVFLFEKSGFTISSLKTIFSVAGHQIKISDFKLKTPFSQIELQAESRISSMATIADTYPDATVKLKVDRSSIALKDILYFSPSLMDSVPVNIPKQTTVWVTALLKGKVNDLTVEQISIETLSDTRLKTRGTITGLPGKDALMHLSLEELSTSNADLQTILSDTLLSKFELPETIVLKGKFDGTIDAPTISTHLFSDDGEIDAHLKMNLRRKGKETYEGRIDVKEFQLGKLLRRNDIGILDINASVSGSGVSMKDLHARMDLLVNTFQYKEYDYKNFKLNGTLTNYFFSGEASLEDKNLNFSFAGDFDYNNDIAAYTFNFDLKNADFKALHLTERPLKARGKIDVDLATADFRKINGTLNVRDIAFFNGDNLYAVDSLLFASIDHEGNSEITIRSDIVSGDFEGTMNLYDMGNALKRHINKYFSLRDTTYSRPATIQRFNFELVLKNTELLTEIILPDLEPFRPGKIEGEFDSENDRLSLHADVTNIRYGSIGVDSLLLDVTSDQNSIDYIFRSRKITMDTIRIEAVALSGTIANDSIRTKLTILDSLEKDKYILGGVFYRLADTLQFRLLRDEVVINYAPWEVSPDNFLQFSGKGIEANNFSITNINEKLSFVTTRQKGTETSIVFKDVNIRNLTDLVEGTIVADGLMNGDLNISGKGGFNSNLKIGDLKVFNSSWGDLTLLASRTSNGPYTTDLTIKGKNVDIRAKGEYLQTSPSATLNLTTTIATLDLSLVEGLAAGQLQDTKGKLVGQLKVNGPITKLGIRGDLHFIDATFTPLFVKTPFLLKDEVISFTDYGVVLKDFKIRDQQNNTASLDGTIHTADYSEFNLDLKLAAKNFQLLNTTEDDNELFYGNVSVNTTATILGSLTQPRIQMQMSLNDDSEFTYVVPQSEKGVLEQKGIVRFVDRDAKEDPFLSSIKPTDTVKSNFSGLDLTANIELDDKETLSIVIDPVTGDKLSVKGNSTLTLDIDPTGDMQLSGRYEITEGTYDLTFYKLVKRNFLIKKGSTITWAGDPLLATMDISASFEVETSPLELVANQTTDQQEINMYRQRLPFLVYLHIRGDLLTPEISFELDMPMDSRNALGGSIYAKIKDINTRESDLNKQVFALLILRRFISDNPFESQTGNDVAATARRSVSKLLTEQLNRLSENIKGIELSFDVKSYEDYSTGQAQGQTEVQLGVTKSLFDERLVVKVSGNVDIEGNASNQSSLTDYIGDLALEYKLTEDGRFRVTGFRNNSYDIISGELIETGAGLIYIKDYNTLRELFKSIEFSANGRKK